MLPGEHHSYLVSVKSYEQLKKSRKKYGAEDEEQLLLNVFKMLVEGVPDHEIMQKTGITDLKLFRWYKSKLIEFSKVTAKQRFENSIAFEHEILHDRLTKMYRKIEEILSDPNLPYSEVPRYALTGADLAKSIFKLNYEGVMYFVGRDNLFDKAKEKISRDISIN